MASCSELILASSLRPLCFRLLQKETQNMFGTPTQRNIAYCETFLPSATDRRQDALPFLRLLLDRGIMAHDQYFLYRDASGETRIAGNPWARVTLDTRTATLVLLATGQIHEEAIEHDPFKQVEQLFKGLPLTAATAYGYITFDAARFYFEYGRKKKVDSPLLCFIVPTIEMRLSVQGTLIRSVDVPVIQDIIDAWGDVSELESPSFHAASLPITQEDRAWYEQSVSILTNAIRADASYQGPFQKAILARSVEVSSSLNPLGTYTLAQKDLSARSYCFQLGDDVAVGSSPENLLLADTQGHIKSHPLAGTRWRGDTLLEDMGLNTQLRTSRKQQMEHLISVVAVQQELETVCQEETVCIHRLAHVQQYRTVQHLATHISGQLAADQTTWDAIRAVFPGVTVSGVSKATAILWIDRIEQVSRGIYAGAIGWINDEGAADLAIAIRTIFQRGVSCQLFCWSGYRCRF